MLFENVPSRTSFHWNCISSSSIRFNNVLNKKTIKSAQNLIGRKGVMLSTKLLNADFSLLNFCHYHFPLLVSSVHLIWLIQKFHFDSFH